MSAPIGNREFAARVEAFVRIARLTRALRESVTERRQAEAAAEESRARLELALRSARMGAWTLDVVTNRRDFDDQTCRLLGIDPAAFTGKPEAFFQVLHSADRNMVKAALARTLEQDAPYEPQYRVIHPDGSIRHIAARGCVVRDNHGRPLRLDGIVWDDTGREMRILDLKREVNEAFA